jgi:UTP--glucose-1-phosphate uridylyltransferase
VLAMQEVPKEDTSKYGIIEGRKYKNLIELTGIVEKPRPQDAKSNLAVVGRYIFNPRVFAMLEQVTPGTGGEIQLTDGIQNLLQHEPVYGYKFDGKRFDCGNKLGYLQASVEYALEHPEVKDEFREYLGSLKT